MFLVTISSGSVPFPKSDKKAPAFGKGARLSDLEFKTTSDLKDIYLSLTNIILMMRRVKF